MRRFIIKLCIRIASRLQPHVQYCTFPKRTPENARLLALHATLIIQREKAGISWEDESKLPECVQRVRKLLHSGASLNSIRKALDEAETLTR